MRNRKKLLPLLLSVLLLFAVVPVRAVFNEKDLARTLKVLRYELSKAYSEMERSQIGFEKQDEKQHEELINLIESCNELSLMLYSQKQDFTFDLTYALQQVTDQYSSFTQKRLPYDNIISYFNVEIDRFGRLIMTLNSLPPELTEVSDTVAPSPSLLDSLAMTFSMRVLPNKSFSQVHADDPDHAGHHHHDDGDDNDDEEAHEHLKFELDSLSRIDRDSCIFYASKLLKMFTDLRDHMVEDSEHYEITDARLRQAYDYAQDRYKLVQKRIFVEGQRNYWYVLTHLRQSISRAVADAGDKYGRDYYNGKVESEWRGPMVLGFSFIILAYLAVAALLSWAVIKILKRKVGKFKTAGFANREYAFILLASLVLFVILILAARLSPSIGTHFFKMASSLLVEFSLLLIAILASLLIRCTGAQIDNGLKLYAPVMLIGLMVIAFRIIFIPNSLINLIFPPLLLLFGFWQLIAFRRNSGKVPRMDRHLATASLVVTAITLAMSVTGYVLMALQLYIWWIFQFTVLQLLFAAKVLLQKYRRRRVDKRVRAYRINHMSEVGAAKGSYILVTWLYDLFDMVLIPLLVILSIPFCLFMASRVFDLTAICTTAFLKYFIDTKSIKLSLSILLVIVAIFFVFRYIQYLVRSLYRIYKVRSAISMKVSGMIRANEVNLTLPNNVIAFIVWGIYIILVIGLLRIPTKSLSVVSAGLAAGLGFAMKDILNNFFYGVQLMSGRLRVGDTLECDGIRGVVDNISYQTTTIKAIDGSLIAFPNSVLFSKTFKNLTRNESYEYLTIPVGVAYGTDVDKARRIILKSLNPLLKSDKFGRPMVRSDYGVQIVLSKFGDSSVDLLVKQYVLVEQRFAYLAKANEAIYKALNDNGIQIPFPQRDIYIKQLPDNQSE